MKSKELLDRIFSPKKRKQIEDILRTRRPAHFQRVYLAGFLKGAIRLTDEEVCRLIHDNCKWGDYDSKITEAQVRSIKKQTRTETQMKKEHLSSEGLRGTQSPVFSSPCKPPGKWIGIKSGCGYVLEWIRETK